MGFFGALGKILGAGAGIAAIPFTGGASATLLPAILGAGAGVAGALSNTKGARTGQQSGSQTSTVTPVENPAYASLGDMLRQRAMQRLNSSMDMSGVAANGISSINSTFDPISMGVNNSLTSRGLGTSPVAGAADATLGAARGSQIAQYLNTLPQLQRQYQNEDFNAANSVFAARPLGTTQTGTQTGTSTAPGSALGSGIGSAAEMIAFLHGQGLLGGKAPTTPPFINPPTGGGGFGGMS